MSVEYIDVESNLHLLQTHGYAVIKNVLSVDDVERVKIEAWKWLRDTPIKNEDKVIYGSPETYKNISQKFFAKHGGLLQYFGIGQAQFVWNVRQSPKVVDVFKEFWKTDDLFVSFDGANLTPPPEESHVGWRAKPWLHTDQSPFRDEISIQGQVTMFDVEDGDGTLCVLEGSHLLHKEFFDTFEEEQKPKEDWFKLNDEQIDWFIERGCRLVAIKAKAGDMILWNSKTIHMGIGPRKTRLEKKWRMVVYVTMFPRSRLTEKLAEKRRIYFQNGRTTPHYGTKLFPKIPRTFGHGIMQTNYTLPVLTKLGESLI